jgi:hypothetical protein
MTQGFMRTKFKATSIILSIFFLFITVMILISGCGKEKIIVREIIYRDLPEPVELIYPVNDTLLSDNNPTFDWHSQEGAINYDIQVSSSSAFINFSINTSTVDTSYTTISQIPNGSYFWRVRAQNADSMWGDWSDATVRTFYKSDNIFYLNLLSKIHTIGTAQDVYIKGDSAYVADGQSELTIVNIMDKHNPFIASNYDRGNDDFAKGIFIDESDTLPFVWVADMDAQVKGINLAHDTTEIFDAFPFGQQNTEDITGKIINDTLYLFYVRSHGATSAGAVGWWKTYYDEQFSNFIFDNYTVIDFPTDVMGIYVNGDSLLLACDAGGLGIVDISDIFNPQASIALDLPGLSLSVYGSDNYAFVAADRFGLYVVDLTAGPDTVSHINTSGRTKDVHLVDDHAFIADGSGGLKIIDVSQPDSIYFVAAYNTPYAYGVWADPDYIYICDRDEGLMIFENLVSR